MLSNTDPGSAFPSMLKLQHSTTLTFSQGFLEKVMLGL